MRIAAGLLLLAAAVAGPGGAEDPPRNSLGMPLLFADGFERGAGAWEPEDPRAWRIERVDGNAVYSQHRQSEVQREVRSPFNRALIRGLVVADFVLEARVQSTTREYGHRDACLFFGFQDPAHHFYAHLGRRADEHAHSLFVVDGAPRVSIARTRTDGTPWTDGWHRARLVRRGSSIRAYFDDWERPVMTADDRRFPEGRVGLGTFDDTARFDDVRVWGVRAGFSR